MLPITGYADRHSVAPGETIEFKISSGAKEDFEARLVRVISGDPNPAGPGIEEQPVDAHFAGRYPSRIQAIDNGSYVRITDASGLAGLRSFTLVATIWPTLLGDRQTIIAYRESGDSEGIELGIGPGGDIGVWLPGEGPHVIVGKRLRTRAWYRVFAAYDAASATLSAGQQALEPRFKIDDSGVVEQSTPLSDSARARCGGAGHLSIGATRGDDSLSRRNFNGKIESPGVFSVALAPEDAFAAAAAERTDDLAARWDFSREMSGTAVVDIGPSAMHGYTVNLPTRAMKGSAWTGEERCWRHAPHHYSAIHFHDDDLYDCGWETDFRFTLPDDFPSGVYAARISTSEDEDMVPFYVRAAAGRPQSSACVLIPTFTYIVYTNFARGNIDDAYRRQAEDWGARPWAPDDHPEYGISTYNFHRDGSGVSMSSRLRPAINQRSGFCAYADPQGGSCLRHFPADTHLLAWLQATGHDYDVVTDEDLDAEGVDLLAPYQVVMTASHPEYHTPANLDALQAYTDGGGRLMYLGGNGFYWRVAVNHELPGAVEIRRGETGIRAWAAEPGEYYNAFDGGYGGLWRNSDRAPQKIAGVGFTSQGDFHGSYYRRLADAADPRASWIFAGIDDEILGDFGLSGGGAGGFELDRADHHLGSPEHTLILARSEGHDDTFMLVPEEILTHHATRPGEPEKDLIRAEIVYYETPNGGAVFSVGSISYCGSLPHNRFDNNISKLTNNVLSRFRSDWKSE